MKYVLFLLFAILSFETAQAGTNDIKTVSLHLNNVNLGSALQSVAEQADVDLVYSDAVVDSLLITCDFDDRPVEKALKSLLHKTSISYKRNGQTEYVLFLKGQQLTLDVSGRIFDVDTGENLPFANITLPATNRGTASSLDGRFLLPSVPFRACTLRVEYIGYASQDIDIDRTSLMTPLKIGLEQSSILSEPVMVYPTNWEIINVGDGAGQFSVAPENFSLLPIAGDKDLFKSLQLLPGVSSSNQESSDLYIHGGTPSQNLVLFDGMTLYHLDHSFGFLSAFNTDAIKDVRVYKSNFSAKYGGRLSGVMEITAKSGDNRNTRLQIGATQLNGHAVLQLPFAGKGALLLSARHSYSNYIIDELYNKNFTAFSSTIPMRQQNNNNRPQQPPPLAVDPDMKFYDLIGKASLNVTPKNNFSVSFFASQDDLERFEGRASNQLRGRPSRQSSNFIREEKADWGNRGASFKWLRQWQERFQSTTMLAYSRFTSDESFFENTPAFAPDPRFSGQGPGPGMMPTDSVLYELNSSNEIEDLTFRLDNVWKLNPAHTPEFGLWISRSRINNINNGIHVIDDLRESNRATQYSAYVQDTWLANRLLMITGGLRATYYGLTQSSYFEPRMSATVHLSPVVSLKGGWGQNHQFIRRMPGFFQYTEGRDFWVLADDRAIKPGYAEHWLAGAKLEARNLLLDLEFYQSSQRNVTEGIPAVQYLEPFDRSAIYKNSNSLSKGIDVLLQQKIGGFVGWISYSYSKTNIKATVRRQVQEFPANHDIPHKLNLVGSFAHKGWNLSATWSYASGTPITKPEIETLPSDNFGAILRLIPPAELNSSRLPTTHRLDASLTRTFFTKHIYGHIGLSIYNLYDQDNIWYRNFVLQDGALVKEDVTTLGFTPTISLDIRFR